VIGRAEVVGDASVAALSAFHATRYVPANIVIAAAGSIDHDALVELAQRTGSERSGGELVPPPVSPSDLSRRVRFLTKDTEQYHVCLGGPGIARDDERRYALRVLDNILGGTSSSRLFQAVRERRGLAYSVFSFQSLYADTGQVGLYVGTRPENLQEAMVIVAEELQRFVEAPATEAELVRSRENLKGRIVLSLESTSARMSRLGNSILSGLPILSIDEVIERIDAVTLDDLRELAVELFTPPTLSAAGVGSDEAAFRAALEPLASGEAVASAQEA